MPIALLFWSGLLLTVLTGFFNLGIISIDDYNNGFAIMVPAQSAPGWRELATTGIHPYLPKLVLCGLAQFFWKLGVENPLWQLRLCLALLGVAVFGSQFAATRRFFRTAPLLHASIALFLIGFYFALPLFSTRPMIETLCMPFLTWSAVFASEYHRRGLLKHLYAAMGLLALASLMRFQAGICVLGLVLVVFQKRQAHDWLAFAGSGLLGLVLTGLPDLFLSGRFHGQLRNYVDYNLQFSGEHFGRMPFYVFIVLAVALTLPPSFFSRFRGLRWRDGYAFYLAPLSYFAFFLLAHSLTPHKEERFIVPVLPVFLFCLVPLAAHLWNHGDRWRKIWFLGLNSFLLILTCTNTAQRNLVALAEWLSAHPEIEAVDGVEQALVIFPQALVLRKIQWASLAREGYANSQCSKLALLRADHVPDADWNTRFKKVARFEPGWVEQVLILANAKNARRGPLEGYLPVACLKQGL